MSRVHGFRGAFWKLATAIGLGLGALSATASRAEGPATVRLWNWNIHDKKYQQNMYKQFSKLHPDIKIEYTSISTTVYAQTLEAAFAANEPPDLFYPDGAYTFHALRTKGLIKPLNEVAPTETELKAWMAQFPRELHKFDEGLGSFGGKVYIVDLTGDAGLNMRPLFYNLTLFKQAGIEKPPATYNEMRRAAAKTTEAGAGKYFGFVIGAKGKGEWYIINHLAAFRARTGILIWGYDPKRGKFVYSGPELTDVLKLFIGMRKDGSVFPGETLMDDEQAKMSFATNKAAMQFGGWWNPGNYLAYNEDADFDLVLDPTPEDGIRGFYYTTTVKEPFGYVVPKATKNPGAVWEVIKFVSSAEYQGGYVKGGFGISYLPEANKPENFTVRQMYKIATWAVDPSLFRVAPAPTDAMKTTATYWPGMYPDYPDVMEAVYLEKSGFEALADLDKRAEEALLTAIKKAQENGVKIAREDYNFPDWDFTKDYVPKKK